MLNKVILIGKISGDPELRYFKNSNTITIIKLMTNENINGVVQNNWHRIVLNKKNNQLKKNMIIVVTGKIKTRRWLDNKNKSNYITEIIAEEIKVISDNEINYKKENDEKKIEGKEWIDNDKNNTDIEKNIEEKEGVEDMEEENDNDNINEYYDEKDEY
ncbi:MAG: single-stranded DNA-binding protein [Candidatus Nasuia deltocephalinicola]